MNYATCRGPGEEHFRYDSSRFAHENLDSTLRAGPAFAGLRDGFRAAAARADGARPGEARRKTSFCPTASRRRDEILKAEHQQNLKDAAELAELAEQLKIDLEKNDRYVVSMATIKKTDDIEKLAKRIRARLRHN